MPARSSGSPGSAAVRSCCWMRTRCSRKPPERGVPLKSATTPPLILTTSRRPTPATMTQLSLQPDLGIEHVAELQATLLPHLEDDAPVQLAGDARSLALAASLGVDTPSGDPA